MRLKGKLVTGAGVILAVSALGIGSVSAAAPPPVNVTHHTLTCDTVTGSIKPTTGITFTGTPGVTTNVTTVKVALDGCIDDTDGTVIISATKFTLILAGSTWVHGTHCQTDGTPTDPVGTGSHSCHAVWGDFQGGKPDHLDHFTDESGNFGQNNFNGLAGASTGPPNSATFVWKCAGALKAKCIEDQTNTAGKPSSTVTIPNTYGSTGTDPFGVGRAAFFVGSPLNGQTIAGTTIPPGTLTQESVTGAFQGNNSGHTGTFKGQLQQSVGVLGAQVGSSTGIKSLTFATGVIVSA